MKCVGKRKYFVDNPVWREIFGAEIQYFRLDPRYWERIIERFKGTGLRCVTTYVQWSTHLVAPPDKKHPAGVLDFTGKTDPRLNLMGFLELIEKHGLNLNFRCGPFCCNEMVHGGYPPWLVLGDPNIMVWDWQNRTTQGYWIGKKEGSQPSYLHPTYLQWCEHWIRAVDTIIGPHLKSNGGCVTMVNLDNEISYIVRDGFLDSDYNPVNVGPGGWYHQFLQKKYGAARSLPYPTKYRSMEEVAPPRSVPEVITTDMAYYLDWIEFKTWVMAEYIRRLRMMHEANGVRDVTFMTNFNPHRPEGVPTRMPALEEATGGGLVGYDFYRGTFMSYSGYHSMARVLKLMNASVRHTWSAEFMSGTWNKVLPSRVSEDHMRFMSRCALAHGCKAMAWFMFHDRDCWGDAPVSSHGHPRANLNVLRETPALLFDKVKDWESLRPVNDVAIIYDLVQHQHTSIGDPMPCADNDLHTGRPAIDGVSAGLATAEYEGLFRLVEQAGLQAGVVDIIHSDRSLADYKIAFLPGSPVMERRAAERLKKFMANGGILVLSGPMPKRDERGRAMKFPGLGVPVTRGPATTLRVGKGMLIWHREYLAQEKPEEESQAAAEFIEALLERYAANPQVRLTVQEPVSWVDWQEGGGHRVYRQPRNLGSAILQRGRSEALLFVMNHYPEAARFRVKLTGHYKVLRHLETGETLALTDGAVGLDLDRKSAEIYEVH
jgi:beta-galactosidase